MLFPITIAFVTYETVKLVDQRDFIRKVASELRLNRSKKDIPDFINSKWTLKKKGQYSYYEFVDKNIKVILYFSDDRLDAWSIVPAN
jgi:hypothetical protein